jgi:arabinogalactan endo-1,4-beta-galactosidase
MPQMETNGYYWVSKAGQRQNLFTVLKSYGLTAISLRTWVNPSNSPTHGQLNLPLAGYLR